MKVLLGITMVLLLAGCSAGIRTELPDGTVSEIDEDVALMQTAAGIQQACLEQAVSQGVRLSVGELEKLSASGQEAYFDYMQMQTVVNALKSQGGGSPCGSEIRAYYTAQAAKHGAWAGTVKSGLGWGFGFLIGKSMFDAFEGMASSAGDHYNVGDVNVQKSDDPTGTGGEGAGTGGDVNGSAVVNIGRGQVATDQAQIPTNVDKNINTGFGNKASSNQDQNRDPNRIDDGGDGSNNEAGLF